MKFYSGLFKIVDIITSCLDWGGGKAVISFGDGVKRCDYWSDEFRNARSVQPNKEEAEPKHLTLVTAVQLHLEQELTPFTPLTSVFDAVWKGRDRLKSFIIEESRW